MRATTAALALALAGVLHAQADAPVRLDTLANRAPSAWVVEKPSNNLRLYQFRLPGPAGDAELVVMEARGDTEANLKRWAASFVPPPGQSAAESSRVDRFNVGDARVSLLDARGTYMHKDRPFDPNSKPQVKLNYRTLTAVVQLKEVGHLVRLTGPAKTVEAHKAAFDDWLKGLK